MAQQGRLVHYRGSAANDKNVKRDLLGDFRTGEDRSGKGAAFALRFPANPSILTGPVHKETSPTQIWHTPLSCAVEKAK